MTYLLSTPLYNQYIFTPITWLHNIKIQHKLSLTFLLLTMMPYQKYLYIIFSIFVVISILLSLKIRQNYHLGLINFIYIAAFYLFLGKINKEKVSISNQAIFNIHFKIFNKCNTAILVLPEFLIRVNGIAILHMISIQLILCTTMYENILMLTLEITKLSNRRLVKVIAICSFACQFLEQIIIYVKTIEVSIKLRNNKSNTISRNIYIAPFIFNNYVSHLKKQINRISSILYVRQIQATNLTTTVF
uniref:Transmembrane protein n=1 Tax=Rhodymenia pseudopalmata TaxID=31502 RepID=A0A1C9C7H3_RHOPU|nr:hypothetical protein Rhodyp_049 [Rhodymenia pseudopalmata]AOM64327.1 hypothetical protein Rhodyp_049 [Rhodymenia pseudopalmata]